MLIERIPDWVRRWFPDGIYRISGCGRTVFLTFDDGPIPEATPEVLDILDRYGVKATFFMVGDNVRKYPLIAEEVAARGHEAANHTFHHVKAVSASVADYEAEVTHPMCPPSHMFRPPHGWIGPRQWKRLKALGYKLVLYDLVTRDYSKRIDAEQVVRNVKRYTRPGSIIVFHDSLKSIGKLSTALPRCIEWLQSEGYSFGRLSDYIRP